MSDSFHIFYGRMPLIPTHSARHLTVKPSAEPCLHLGEGAARCLNWGRRRVWRSRDIFRWRSFNWYQAFCHVLGVGKYQKSKSKKIKRVQICVHGDKQHTNNLYTDFLFLFILLFAPLRKIANACKERVRKRNVCRLGRNGTEGEERREEVAEPACMINTEKRVKQMCFKSTINRRRRRSREKKLCHIYTLHMFVVHVECVLLGRLFPFSGWRL